MAKSTTKSTKTSNVVSAKEYAEQGWSEIEATLAKARGTSNMYSAPALIDSVFDSKEKIIEISKKSKPMKDHYSNSLSATGGDDKVAGFATYGFSADSLQWPLWMALYNDSWVFKRAIDKPSQDIISAGFTIHGAKDYDRVYKMYDRYKNQLCDILKWGRLFGGSIGVLLFDNVKDEDLKKPLIKKNIVGKRFKIYVTDRWYGLEPSVNNLVTDMRDIDFGKPKYYNVTMANGTSVKVHHSYVLRYENRGAPNLIKNGYLQGWGYAEGAHIINELARDDQLKSSITSLVNKSLIEIIKMSGMRGVFMGTDKGNEVQLRKRLEMVNWGRTYNSLTFLDKDDEYQQHQLTSISGLAELMEKNMWLISSALEMQGILFGDLKGGLSQESDAFTRYSQTIYNICETLFRPVLNKFLTILFIVCDIKEGKDWEKPDFDFEYLDKFERNKNKVAAISEIANMLSKLEQDGVISKYQYAMTIKNYVNGDNLNLVFTDAIINKLKLEEEYAILETIEEISKKKKKNKLDLGQTPNIPTTIGELEESEVKETSTETSATPEVTPEASSSEASAESEAPQEEGTNNE